jgi:predicted DNA-binding transcriptional regulator YafY
MEEIINKLQNTVTTNAKDAATIIQFEKQAPTTGNEYIDDIFSAIKEKTPLRISYQSFKAKSPDQYIFHPYLLKEYRNRWFLIGRKENSNTITNLALDRIKSIKNSSSPYLHNDLFQTEVYFNNLIGVSVPTGERIQEIEIKVTSKQAPYVRTKPIHHTQEIIKEYSNGDILIRLYLICNYELKSTLLGFGCDLEVTKPADLREEIKNILQSAVHCYSI